MIQIHTLRITASILFLSALLLVPALFAFADSSDVTITVRFFECNDGVDNDNDSLIDYPSDPGCDSVTDDNETDTMTPACSDGTDNDGDSKVDFPDDPGCSSSSDDSEVDLSSGSSGGGGRGGSSSSGSRVLFIGTASPQSTIFLLKDARLVETSIADENAQFSVTLSRVSEGLHLFSLYTRDVSGVRSGLLSFDLSVVDEALTEVSDIFIPPTLDVHTSEIGGEPTILLSGFTVPSTDVILSIVEEGQYEQKVRAGTTGRYQHFFPAESLSSGRHLAKARTVTETGESPFSTTVAFTTNGLHIVRALPGDHNQDGGVDLADFSIALYWFVRGGAPTRFDLDGNGRLDLVDFSIMIHHWSA